MHTITRAGVRRALVAGLVLTSAFAIAAAPAAAATGDARAPDSARIINGTQVDPGGFTARWTFMVALVLADYPSEEDGFLCGGSLVAPTIVVTAAHCVTPFGERSPLMPAELDVVTGRRVFTDQSIGERLDVAAVFVHPGWVAGSVGSDLAVLRLASPSLSTPIDVVQDTADHDAAWGNGAGAPATGGNGPWLAGWGDRSWMAEGTLPEVLYEVEVPIRSDAACAAARQAFLDSFVDQLGDGWFPPELLEELVPTFDPATMVCAGVLDTDGSDETSNGKDSCFGDSGGPLTAWDAVAGEYILVGVTSWGAPGWCADTDLYGVYTRLDAPAIRALATDASLAASGPGGLQDPVPVGATTGQTTATVTWTAPGAGPPPTRYRVFRRATFTAYDGVTLYYLKRLAEVNAPTTGATVTRLTPNTQYTFFVQSMTALGLSGGVAAPIVASTLPDTKPPTRPGAPHLRGRSSSSLKIRWAPSTDNHRVRFYHVFMRYRRGWRRVGKVSSWDRAFRKGRLRPLHRYRFLVKAEDPAGNVSQRSQIRTFMTMGPGNMDAPGGVTVVPTPVVVPAA